MLVQDYLRQYGLEKLQQDLNIKVTEHEDGRVILNYDQLDDVNKYNPINRECRGLVLDKNNDWKLIAKAFNRFFNVGEFPEEQNQFIWTDSLSTEKVDGSLILIYFWKDKWVCNTRASFADGKVGQTDYTWTDLVQMCNPRWKELQEHITYVCELCTPYNKVVKPHPKPKLYLLSLFHGDHELSYSFVPDWGNYAGFSPLRVYEFNDVRDVQHHIERESAVDPLYEGVVLRDRCNRRLKLKSQSYMHFHWVCSGPISDERLLEVYFSPEKDEIACYMEDIRLRFENIDRKLFDLKRNLCEVWEEYSGLESQKDFALAVKHHPFSGYLFSARQKNVHPVTLVRNDNYLYKLLFVKGNR